MSDEKLDLILNVVTDIKTHQEDSEKTDADVNLKLDKLSEELTNLKKHIVDPSKTVQNSTVSKKSTDKMNLDTDKKINADSKIINRLESEIIAIKIDAIDTREKIQELEIRVSRFERRINLAA